jgi:hypothetical protein
MMKLWIGAVLVFSINWYVQSELITPIDSQVFVEEIGECKLSSDTYTLILMVDLEEIENRSKELTKKADTIRSICKRKNISINMYSCTNFNNIVKKKLEKVKDELGYFIDVENRKKRSLNELGSIWKIITGNLDYNDGIRIDNSLMNLRNYNRNFTEFMKNNTEIIINNSNAKTLIIKENTNKINEILDQIRNISDEENLEKFVEILDEKITFLFEMIEELEKTLQIMPKEN